ncbi:MAG: hypothetical protein ACLR7D_07645 [Lachnospira eligens]
MDIAEIGAVIVATSTADNAFPSTAAIVTEGTRIGRECTCI